jgi:hypothetical protein
VIGADLASAWLKMADGNGHQYLVGPLTLRCSNILSSADSSLIKTATGAGDPITIASYRTVYCPDGNVGFGVKGRAGQFIDALSLGCRPYQ